MIFQRTNVEMGSSTRHYFILCIALIMLFYGVSVGINITSLALFLHQMGFVNRGLVCHPSRKHTHSRTCLPERQQVKY
jgi:hypothetical protein